MPAWDALSDRMEADIDALYSVPVVVSPYKKQQYMADSVPDTSRQVRDTKGYRISKYTNIRKVGSTFSTKRTEADLLLCIREEFIPDTVSGDRVLLQGHNYDISFCEYWGNGRTVLHLLKRHS